VSQAEAAARAARQAEREAERCSDVLETNRDEYAKNVAQDAYLIADAMMAARAAK
jgi:hypothetical protein